MDHLLGGKAIKKTPETAPLGYSTLFLGLLAFGGWFVEIESLFIASTSLASVQILNRIFPFRFTHWLRSLAFEALAIPLALLLRTTRGIKRPLGVENKRPILLVHGYLHDRSAWFYLKSALAKKGVGPVYTLNLGGGFLPIEQYGEKVAAFVKQIEQEIGAKTVTLIGHSMGGLVSTYYATHLAPTDTVTDVITIGSPLAGTFAAYLGRGPNAKQMRPNSLFTQSLREKIANAKNIRFHQIGSRTDFLIVPQNSALIGNQSERQCLINDLGHMTLLYSPRVLNQIVSFLS